MSLCKCVDSFRRLSLCGYVDCIVGVAECLVAGVWTVLQVSTNVSLKVYYRLCCRCRRMSVSLQEC